MSTGDLSGSPLPLITLICQRSCRRGASRALSRIGQVGANGDTPRHRHTGTLMQWCGQHPPRDNRRWATGWRRPADIGGIPRLAAEHPFIALRQVGDECAADPQGPMHGEYRKCGAAVYAAPDWDAGHDVHLSDIEIEAGPGLVAAS